jgi:hypothetical protein
MSTTKTKKVKNRKGGNATSQASQAPQASQDDIKYLVEDVDVNGDGIPDGVLVKQYKIDKNNNKHFLSQVFVPNDKLKERLEKEAREYKQQHPEIIQQVEQHPDKNYLDPRNNGGLKIVDEKGIARLEDGRQIPQTQHVIIQDETTLAQHVKAGVGLGVGFGLADMLGSFFQGLFSSE